MKTQKISYLFTPAGITSNFVPLIVILYGEEGIKLTDFEYKMWNTLQVCSLNIDEESLEELIVDYAETYECEDYVFVYGEIEGIKNTISKGVLLEHNTMYANASELNQRDKLKKVLEEFEKMVPNL